MVDAVVSKISPPTLSFKRSLPSETIIAFRFEVSIQLEPVLSIGLRGEMLLLTDDAVYIWAWPSFYFIPNANAE